MFPPIYRAECFNSKAFFDCLLRETWVVDTSICPSFSGELVRHHFVTIYLIQWMQTNNVTAANPLLTNSRATFADIVIEISSIAAHNWSIKWQYFATQSILRNQYLWHSRSENSLSGRVAEIPRLSRTVPNVTHLVSFNSCTYSVEIVWLENAALPETPFLLEQTKLVQY